MRSLSAVILGLVVGCASAQPSLKFVDTSLIQKNPEIKLELTNFLETDIVTEELGFDPLYAKFPVVLDISEYSVIRGYGNTYTDGTASLNGFLFSGRNPRKYLQERGINPEPYDSFFVAHQELCSNPKALELYRKLTAVHEVAHIAEQHGFVAELTGHGVTDRIETRILTRMYREGSVSGEQFEFIYGFLEKHRNNAREDPEKIKEYKQTILSK